MSAASDHLTECPGCTECDHLMSLYTACDGCGMWMNNDCGHYYDLESGETLCGFCEPEHANYDYRGPAPH